MTDGVRRNMQQLAGAMPNGCPWNALRDPLVIQVIAATPLFESGQLAFLHPKPSHRLVSAIRLYESVSNRIHCRQLDLERAERERVGAALPMRGGRRG